MWNTGFEFAPTKDLRIDEARARYQYYEVFAEPMYSEIGRRNRRAWRRKLIRILNEKQRRKYGGALWHSDA